MTQFVNRYSNIDSVLVADCGSNTTRVALIEVVDQAYRFVARGEAPSTLEAPYGDVTVGVINAIGAIESSSGRRLLLGGKLIVPQQEDGSGVDAFVASSSAAEPLRVVAAGLVRNLSASSAARASHSTYTTVLDTMSLDDYGDGLEGLEPGDMRDVGSSVDFDPDDPEAEFSPFAHRKDRTEVFPPDPDAVGKKAKRPRRVAKPKKRASLLGNNPRRLWKERQIAKLRRLAPNVVVMSGGSDGTGVDALLKLVEVVLETNRQENLLAMATGETRRPLTLIFAGNKAAEDKIVEQVAGQFEIFMVDNIRPTPDRENLAPLQRQLSALYQERLLPTLPGYRRLNELSAAPINTSCAAVGLITQFLAKDVEANRVLTADLGGANTALFYADAQNYASMVRGGFGLSFGLSNVLAETSTERVRRWLPFDDASDDELIHYALNKTLRPHILPATERELFIEGAFGREALHHLIDELNGQSLAGYDYNRIIGAGGPLVNVPLWQAALLLLDGLQPPGASETGLVELDLDSTMLMAAAGTLATINPNAASYLFRYDCLHRLGAVVVVQGEGSLGSTAVTVTLRKSDGRTKEVKVPFGSIALLPLRADEQAGLEIKLGGSFRLGNSERGATVSTAPGRDITGGALGLIIDARGRPVKFAPDAAARREQVANWYQVYREALQQAEQEGSDDFAPGSGPSQPTQPSTGLVTNNGQPLAAPRAKENDKPEPKLKEEKVKLAGAEPKVKPVKEKPAPRLQKEEAPPVAAGEGKEKSKGLSFGRKK